MLQVTVVKIKTATINTLWSAFCLNADPLVGNASPPQNSAVTRQEKEIASSGSAKWGKIKELAAKITTKSRRWPVRTRGATCDGKFHPSPLPTPYIWVNSQVLVLQSSYQYRKKDTKHC